MLHFLWSIQLPTILERRSSSFSTRIDFVRIRSILLFGLAQFHLGQHPCLLAYVRCKFSASKTIKIIIFAYLIVCSSSPTPRPPSLIAIVGPASGYLEVLSPGPLRIAQVDILALQSNTYGGGSVAVAPMAQPNAEAVEDY